MFKLLKEITYTIDDEVIVNPEQPPTSYENKYTDTIKEDGTRHGESIEETPSSTLRTFYLNSKPVYSSYYDDQAATYTNGSKHVMWDFMGVTTLFASGAKNRKCASIRDLKWFNYWLEITAEESVTDRDYFIRFDGSRFSLYFKSPLVEVIETEIANGYKLEIKGKKTYSLTLPRSYFYKIIGNDDVMDAITNWGTEKEILSAIQTL